MLNTSDLKKSGNIENFQIWVKKNLSAQTGFTKIKKEIKKIDNSDLAKYFQKVLKYTQISLTPPTLRQFINARNYLFISELLELPVA